MDGVLTMNWSYSDRMFKPATMEALAAGFRAQLVALIDHCVEVAGRAGTA